MADAPVVIKIEGGRKLRKTLKDAGDDLQDLRKVHARVSAIVAARARKYVPIGKTRKLHNSIRSTGTKNAAIIRVGSNAKKGVRYAMPIHWGWPARKIKPSRFLYNAAKQTAPFYHDIYEKEVEKILSKVKGAE